MLLASVLGCSKTMEQLSVTSEPIELTTIAETTVSAETVPDRGVPDKSALVYPDVMEPYRKSDWQANWIWIKGPHEDCYAAFRKTFTADTAQDAKMDDRQAPPIGTEGTVRGVDDIGSVMVAWDNGCGLNVVLDEDEIEIIET